MSFQVGIMPRYRSSSSCDFFVPNTPFLLLDFPPHFLNAGMTLNTHVTGPEQDAGFPAVLPGKHPVAVANGFGMRSEGRSGVVLRLVSR
jgi:hypothetical protein